MRTVLSCIVSASLDSLSASCRYQIFEIDKLPSAIQIAIGNGGFT